MKRFGLCLLFVLGFLSANLAAAELGDGLYAISDKPTAFPFTTLDGRDVYLGAKLPDKLKETRLISFSNDNSAYRLILVKAGPFSADLSHVALVLNGKCAQFYGLGSDDNTHEFFTDTALYDGDFIKLAGAYFKITPQDRHHPGHQFIANFIARHTGYALKDPIPVTFRITNCGARPFFLMSWGFLQGKYRGCPSPAFIFSACAEGTNEPVQGVPNHFTEQAMSMMIPGFMLKPGETRSIDVDLKDYLKFQKIGNYTIRGSCGFSVAGDDVPLGWDDYGTADFRVEIK